MGEREERGSGGKQKASEAGRGRTREREREREEREREEQKRRAKKKSEKKASRKRAESEKRKEKEMKCLNARGVATRPTRMQRHVVVAARANRQVGLSSKNRHNAFTSCKAARGTYNTDYSGTEDFKRHDKDVGSSEYQIARISTRIKQLTEHLKEHKTDHATRRGLMALLNKRNKLLQYLFQNDRKTYTNTIQALGIRSRLTDTL